MDLKGSLQLLSDTHLRERDRGLLRGILSGRVWNEFLLCHAGEKSFRADFAARLMGMGIFFFGIVLTLPLFISVKILNFTDY